MSKSIKILFLALIVFLSYKSPVLSCAPGFPEYIYDSSQILEDYYPLIQGVGSSDFKTNPLLNKNFEVIAPVWGPEYLLPVYLASINKEMPEMVKEAWAKYTTNRDYYAKLKRNEPETKETGLDSPVMNEEKSTFTFGQKLKAWFDSVFNQSRTEEEMENEYKLAADQYYKGDYDKAIRLFSAIYKNKKQINRDKAALSLGWSYIAKANQQYEIDLKNESNNAENNLIKNLKIAQNYYEKIATDQSLSEVKGEIDKYLDYVLYRTDPVARMTRAGKVMLTTSDSKEFLRNLNDYIPLWYKYFYRYIVYKKEVPEYKEFSQKIRESGDEFSQFLLAWTDLNSNSLDQNLKKYKDTKSPLWLIVSQRQTNPESSQWAYLGEEIKAVAPTSPFYLSSQYYRLSAQINNIEMKTETKSAVSNLILETDKNKQYSAQNLFNSLMLNLSDTIEEKQKYSLMNNLNSYWTFYDSTSWAPYYQYLNYENTTKDKVSFISNDMKKILSSTDTEKLNELLSKENIFTPEIKQYLRLVLFTKSALDNQLNISKNMAVLLLKNNPVIAKDLSAFIKAQNTEEQKFLAAKFILDYPEITDVSSQSFDEFIQYDVKTIKEIDNHRRNWAFEDKCAMRNYPSYYEKYEEYKNIQINSDDLVVNKIGQIIIDFASSNPNYNSVPQALSQVVDLVHYGSCTDKKSAEYAKRAFQLLHTNYSSSYWAKQTPYWYE